MNKPDTVDTMIPTAVMRVLTAIHKKGYEAYIVGGCVRDCILDRCPNDWDITTSALPHEIKKIFSRTFDTGIKHGTVTVLYGEMSIECTTYRLDGEYANYRHPSSVEFTNDITKDLARRDFTINAIAYNPSSGYVDPFNGREHIQSKLITCVGSPDERFTEDALRLLRAVRFSSQLGFEIEEGTFLSIQRNLPLIVNISTERIRDELLKILLSERSAHLETLYNFGLFGYILPELVPVFDNNDLRRITIEQIKCLPSDIDLRLASLLRTLDIKSAHTVLKWLKLDNKTIKSITMLLSMVNIELSDEPVFIKQAIAKLGSFDFFYKLMSLRHDEPITDDLLLSAKMIQANNEPVFMKDLAVTGDDLKAIGYTNGREIGSKLSELLEFVYKHPNSNVKGELTKLLSI